MIAAARRPLSAAPARLLVCGLLVLACGRDEPAAPQAREPASPAPEAARFVGSAACAPCHAEESRLWRGSHHDLALQVADERTVLGRFDGRTVTRHGVETTFDLRDGRHVVRTEGADGTLQDFVITETFGIDPLQQYLVALPGGRKHALAWAWDTRPAEAGGQRWIHLGPEERIEPGDPLHWTGVAGNWNHQCAECHSTQVRKGYDVASGRYDTTFAEEDVGCEACHGPASAHLAWATRAGKGHASGDEDPAKGLVFRIGAHDDARWVRASGERIAHRSRPRASQSELETCARCHSRRALLSEDYVHGRSILDTHRPVLLDEGLYFADGQIQDEVYEYGSFLQSRMHARGVSCSDCHDSHSLHLRAEGNALCGTCHAPEVFDVPAHHHHEPGTEAVRCVSCHMPARTYMQVDVRHDHGFRVPRPELSAEIGAPDVCTGCHVEQSARWAADAISGWRGAAEPPRPHFGRALHAGRTGAAEAESALVALAQDESEPDIARATALDLLAGYLSPDSLPALQAGLEHEDPLLRLAAAGAAEALPPPQRLALLAPLLRDPVRAVRLEAAGLLAGVPAGLWPPGERAGLADALAEYRAAQATHLDRPEAQLNLGNLHVALGEPEAALARYEEAIRLEPRAIPAHVNRADLLRQLGREAEVEASLREVLAWAPDDADVHHALGLSLVRQKRMPEAVEALGRAAELAPERSRYVVAWALALEAAGRKDRAVEVVEEAFARRPGDPELASLRRAWIRDEAPAP